MKAVQYVMLYATRDGVIDGGRYSTGLVKDVSVLVLLLVLVLVLLMVRVAGVKRL